MIDPAATSDHHRDHRLAQHERRHEVHRDDRLEVVEIGVENPDRVGQRGVVDQDVDRSEPVNHRVNDALPRRRLGDIGHHDRGLTALLLDETPRVISPRRVAIDEHHAGACTREQHRDRLAGAESFTDRASAGDDRDPTGESPVSRVHQETWA